MSSDEAQYAALETGLRRGYSCRPVSSGALRGFDTTRPRRNRINNLVRRNG
jgi:hypothetical protein